LECRHWLSSHSRHSTYSYEATAGGFDRRLSLWGELFGVSIGIGDVDFSDEIDRGLCLSMQSAHRGGSNQGSGKHS